MGHDERLANSLTPQKMAINRLPVAARISVARDKYAAAVNLYASSSLSIREIAEQTGLTPKALSHYLSKHHRSLLYKRYDIHKPEDNQTIRIKSPKGQSRETYLKYKDAIEACGDLAFVEFNISHIARIFNVDPTGLSSQFKVHYPDILPAREAIRKRLCIADHIHRGPHPSSKSAYEEAVEIYKDSDLSIQQIADRFGISKSGFGQYMRFYHHDAIKAKARRRQKAGDGEAGQRKAREEDRLVQIPPRHRGIPKGRGIPPPDSPKARTDLQLAALLLQEDIRNGVFSCQLSVFRLRTSR